MEYNIRPILGVVCLVATLGVLAACSSSPSNSGVARIDEPSVSETSDESTDRTNTQSDSTDLSTSDVGTSDSSVDNSELTDEEITTLFTVCMRDHGFNIADPKLHADGTVDRQALRQSITQDPKLQTRGERAFGDCLPLLEGATFAQPPSPEEQIELQDNLLEFAQCLREHGIDVPDPDFSIGGRAAMRPLIQAVNLSSTAAQENMRLCRQQAFSGETPRR